MRLFAIMTLLAACGRNAEPPATGAFTPEDTVTKTAGEARISVDRTAVPLAEMGMGRWLAGLPMQGLASVAIDLAAPIEDGRARFSRAHGSFAFACEKDCRIGDDVAPLVVRGQALDVGHLDLASLEVRGTVEGGRAKLTTWKLASPDVNLAVDLDIALADDLAASTIEGCIRFAQIDGLEKRRPRTWAAVQTTGASRDAAGMFTIRITGTLGAPKRMAQACDSESLTMK